MVRAIKSYFTAMRATRRFGRASRLSESGRKIEAMHLAREALGLLAQPHVIRTNPAEVSLLVCATVLVEGLARELNQPGASAKDVEDSLKSLRDLGAEAGLTEWVPYLEWRSSQGVQVPYNNSLEQP